MVEKGWTSAILPILYLILLPSCILSQEEKHELWLHPIHSLSDFTPNNNYWIYRDQLGFAWVSSFSGLHRFDGMRMKEYNANPKKKNSIADDLIQSNFFEDESHDIWFSSFSAINRYRRKKDDFETISKDSLPDRPAYIYLFFLEKNKFLWYSTGEGVYRYDIEKSPLNSELVFRTPTRWLKADTIENGSVKFIYGLGNRKQNQSRFWEVNGSTLVDRPHWFNDTINSTPEIINDIYFDQKITWVGTNEGLVKWNRNQKEWYLFNENAPTNYWVEPWKEDRLIIWSPPQNLCVFDKENKFEEIKLNILDKSKPTDQNLFDIYIDRDENIWASFFSSGFMFANLNKSKFQSLPKLKIDNLSKNDYAYSCFTENEDGTIWHGTKTNGLVQLNKNGTEIINHIKSEPNKKFTMPSSWVTGIETGKNGKIWVATRNGFGYFLPQKTGDTFFQVDFENKYEALDVTSLFKSSNEELYFTTGNNGIFKIIESNDNIIWKKLITPGNTYIKIHEGKNNYYACRDANITEVFSKLNFSHIGQIDFPGVVSGYLENYAKKILWIASSSGLAKIDISSPGSFRTIEEYYQDDGLPTNSILGIKADANDDLWLSTTQGLVKFFPQKDSFRIFNMADGGRSSEFYLGASLSKKNGELWFGGSQGITIVPEDGHFDDVQNKPFVQLTGVEINQEKKSIEEYYLGKLNPINYSENTIALEFAGMEYSDPSNIQLQYKLEGVDEEYISVPKGTYGLARYPNLSFGKYSFYVRAINADNIKVQAGKKLLEFTVLKPWYIQWWALALYLIVLSSLIYLYYRYRISQILQEEEKLRREAYIKQKEAEFRQKEAELKQQMAETETAILRLQMNPHFIFNSMNSINSYILKKDVDTASDYLRRFSKLMRMILDLAVHKCVTVFEEAELLELYMQTEAMRFEQKFTYQINIDENIDPDDIILPTMILQPFVENAIWHGLANKNGQGQINIHFDLQEDGLICRVIDNGIGRENSAKNKIEKDSHESKALGITKRRLYLLEKETKQKSSFEIIDLKDDRGIPCGTEVKLTLPIL